MDGKLKAFLDLIAYSEGTSTSSVTKNDGYDVIVTGVDGPSIFTDYSDHPFANGGSVVVRRDRCSFLRQQDATSCLPGTGMSIRGS